MVIKEVTLSVQPTLSVMLIAVGEEVALWVVLAQSLAIRGYREVGHMEGLVEISVTQSSLPEVVLTWQVDLSIITGI